MRGACSQNVIAGNKTSTSGVVCVVVKDSVCLESRNGDFVPAPRYVIPGRGLHANYGQWGSSGPASRTPLGDAVLVSRRPRDRVGFRGTAREHARYQRQWNVYRSRGSALDWRGLHGALESQAAVKGRLFRETNRTGARDGRFRGTCRIRKPETLPGSSFLALRDRRLRAIYTRAGRGLVGVQPGEE